MGTVLRIVLRDLKRILTNPVGLVITLGVCIIPSLYAWTNIVANNDPYENTSTVPVAVAVLDRGANVEGIGSINAGSMVRERLEENHQLGWTFVPSADAAQEGVKAGRYYAAFVIPEDFTEGLAGVLDGHVEPARIAYYVNEKENAVAPKVTDTGAGELESQIADEFASVVGKTVTEKLQGALGGASEDLSAAGSSAQDDLTQTADLLENLADTLDGTKGAFASARTSVDNARTTIGELTGASETLGDDLARGRDLLGTARSEAQANLSALSAALGNGSSALAGISSTAAYDIGALAGDVGWAQGKLDAALSELRSLNGTVVSLKGSLEDVRTVVASLDAPTEDAVQVKTEIEKELDGEIDVLVSLSDTQLAQIDRLQRASDNVKASADSVRNLADAVNDAVRTSSDELAALQSDIAATAIPKASEGLDAFADAGASVSAAASSLPALLGNADTSLKALDGLLEEGSDVAQSAAASLRGNADDVRGLARELAALQNARNFSHLKDALGIDPEDVGAFMASPVSVRSDAVYPVRNYGSGVAPFYTNLALWVGGFVLVAIYHLEVDEEGAGGIAPWQAFAGRGLLLALLGQVQALICCAGDLALGVQCVSPAAYLGAGMVASFVYVGIVYALAASFKHIGKALGVLLVVLQIPGASGLYPIQMQPGFFQALGPWLPFTYGINAMREAVAGFYGFAYAHDLFVLFLFLLPALALGLGVRRRLGNVVGLFDRELAGGDLFIGERQAAAGSNPGIDGIVRALMATNAYRAQTMRRAKRFERSYPRLVRRGFIGLALAAPALALLGLVVPSKLDLLAWWTLALTAGCMYLVVVEYLHDRLARELELARRTPRQLNEQLGRAIDRQRKDKQ